MAAKRSAAKAPAKAATKKAPAKATAKKAPAKKATAERTTFDPEGLTTYRCVICGRAKPVDAFYRHGNGRRNTRCRLCGAVVRGVITKAEAEDRWAKQSGSAKKAAAKAPAKKAAARKAAGK